MHLARTTFYQTIKCLMAPFFLLASFPVLQNSFSPGLSKGLQKNMGMKYESHRRKIPARGRGGTHKERGRWVVKRIKSWKGRENNTQISERNLRSAVELSSLIKPCPFRSYRFYRNNYLIIITDKLINVNWCMIDT